MIAMRRWIALVLLAALTAWQLPVQAQARMYNQAELDALIAPDALYPDEVLYNMLVASTYPDDVARQRSGRGERASEPARTRRVTAQPMPWHPSVKALVAFPDLLGRMNESPAMGRGPRRRLPASRNRT